ncbi:MAG: ABC-F family ATP-binding cassette domain-containing protein [Chloroflexi bacterium]|nr:ABC-F family ATP-binding cassette domain-containing protein [Chloroflexota bacterium]MBU1746544.1 ABC-F family ATP-binding cassette domain-containing protein [Chloroflexota bacterium]
MSILSAHNLGKSFVTQQVFRDVTVHVDKGARVALVGTNGSGKTTLLRMLADLERPDTGHVTRRRGLRIGYLPQIPVFETDATLYQAMLTVFDEVLALQSELRELETALGLAQGDEYDRTLARYDQALQRFEQLGGYDYEIEIRRVLRGLGFDQDELDMPCAHLSGGQATRGALAQLLLSRPDLLLLDEPTNHLDLTTLEWLEGYLLHWTNSLVVVAHDRRFLDKIATEVWELSFLKLETYTGNYSAYVQERAERLERRRREYEAQQEHIAQTEEFIRRYIAGQRTKEAQGRRKRLERLERVERPQEERAVRMRLQAKLRGGRVVLSTHSLTVGYPAKALFRCPDLEMERGERVALIGPNGSGKTTFLRIVLGQVRPLTGESRLGVKVRPGYYAQAREELDPTRSVLETMLDRQAALDQPVHEGTARNILATYLFTGEDVFKEVNVLSGGERSRLALALLSLDGANLLLLDEPTNHLDLMSQEVLEGVLSDFNGSLLFVSHDRSFIDALATQVWAVEGDELRAYPGNYADYLAMQQAAEPAPDAEQPTAKRQEEQRRQAQREERAQTRAERQRQEQALALEAEVDELETHLAAIEHEIAQGVGPARIAELGHAYAQTEQRLAECLAAWEQLLAE